MRTLTWGADAGRPFTIIPFAKRLRPNSIRPQFVERRIGYSVLDLFKIRIFPAVPI